MKYLSFLVLILGCVASVQAIPPFGRAFNDLHARPGTPLEAKVKVAKCSVCHQGTRKADRNEFGKAVRLHLKKDDFIGPHKIYTDPRNAPAQKALADGLAKALLEKSPSGQTFKELIEGGNLPIALPNK